MQDPKATHARKAWYQRAMDMAATTWRSIPNKIPPTHTSTPTPRPTNKIWKTMTKGITIFPTTTTATTGQQQQQQRRLRKCSSMGVARVCLCAPISYADIFRPSDNYYIPPRRSNSYPRSKSMLSGAPVLPTSSSSSSPRPSVESRRAIFRGKSLTEDVLMRRFVVEEEAGRKRDQMEVIRRRSHLLRKRKKLGPSPLSRMLTASHDHYY